MKDFVVPRWRGQGVEETRESQWKEQLCLQHKLQPLANKLRREMTKAEACLWKYVLREGQMKGYQFRRQRPVLRYIADFMCKELKLVIEVDGVTHQYEETAEKDNRKPHDLERAGFEVIRFTDDDVRRNMNGVIAAIRCVVKEREKRKVVHPLHPPPAGDRGIP
ncbi:MAG: DUF559 domain-containing protein [Planctomycetes bacterium]|nr:DUF559 domain-containing protein [Planctomycetota bacterium]